MTQTPYNSSTCGDSDKQGTEVLTCNLIDFGNARGGSLWEKGTKTLIASFSETEFDKLILSRKIHQFGNLFGFKQTNAKNEVATSDTKKEVTTQKGLSKIEFENINNPCLHKALYMMAGQDKYDLVLYFDEGVLIWTDSKKLNFKGVSGGRFDVANLDLAMGTNPMKSMAEIQLDNPNEYNTRFVFKTWADLGFDALEKRGVIDTNLTIIGTPTATATTITIEVNTSCGNSPIVGLDDVTLVKFGVKGTTSATVTAVSAVLGSNKYVLTLSSGGIGANKTAQFYLTDGTGMYNVATDIDGRNFAGNSAVLGNL